MALIILKKEAFSFIEFLINQVSISPTFYGQFYARRSQKRKKIQSSHQYLFMLSGSSCVKAVRRTLMMKLSQDFGNIGFNILNVQVRPKKI